MLSRDASDLNAEEFGSFLRGIQSGSERLRKLIENFIFLVELETGEAAATFNWRKRAFADYAGLMRSVAEIVAMAVEESSITLVSEVTDDLPPIEGDREYLIAALTRLVENAIKFSKPEGGTVTVHIDTVPNGDLRIAVTDTGRGIPESELKDIFEPFYQGDRERFEDQGAGSGLAIVKGVVDLHGGAITVESTVGTGSTFTIILPAHKEPAHSA
jgi:signal transduction histidine kinase